MRTLLGRLPPRFADMLRAAPLDEVTEMRVRKGEATEFRLPQKSLSLGKAVSGADVRDLVVALTGQSFYAWEERMRDGFFTLPGGCRVGLCGRCAPGGDLRLQEITGVCIRVCRDHPGAADALMPFLLRGGAPVSCLILSSPGMGKTTLLREAVRTLSNLGWHVAVADERGELNRDMGPRTDVLSFCPKTEAIPRLIRSMGPQIVATDEVGGAEDARTIEDAARSGVAVLATAHAGGYPDALSRRGLGEMLRGGAFERVAELAGAPGRLTRILDAGGDALWTLRD